MSVCGLIDWRACRITNYDINFKGTCDLEESKHVRSSGSYSKEDT